MSKRKLGNPVGEAWPLSPAQQQFAFWEDVISGCTASYNLGLSILVERPASPADLSAVLNTIVSRHAGLAATWRRTAFGYEQLLGCSAPAVDRLKCDPADLSRVAADVVRRPFKVLDGEPLVRCVLLEFARDRHAIVWVMHHGVADAAAFTRTTNELIGMYVGGHERAVTSADMRALQFYERAAASYEDGKRTPGMWSNVINDMRTAPLTTDLVYESRHGEYEHEHQDPTLRTTARLFSADAVSRIERMARSLKVSEFQIVLTAILAELASSTTSEPIAFVAWSSQTSALRGAVGCFVDSVPLRAGELAGAEFDAAVNLVSETLRGARRSGAPGLLSNGIRMGSAIQNHLTVERLISVGFDDLRRGSTERPSGAGWSFVPLELGFTDMSMALRVIRTQDGIGLEVSCAEHRLSAEGATRMLAGVEQAVGGSFPASSADQWTFRGFRLNPDAIVAAASSIPGVSDIDFGFHGDGALRLVADYAGPDAVDLRTRLWLASPRQPRPYEIVLRGKPQVDPSCRPLFGETFERLRTAWRSVVTLAPSTSPWDSVAFGPDIAPVVREMNSVSPLGALAVFAPTVEEQAASLSEMARDPTASEAAARRYGVGR